MHLNYLAKLNEGAGHPDRQAVVNYYYMRVLLYAKMLRQTETEETIGFLLHFYHW